MSEENMSSLRKVKKEVKKFIDSYYISDISLQPQENRFNAISKGRHIEKRVRTKKMFSKKQMANISAPPGNFANLLDESFSETLRRFIIAKNMTDTEVWKRANIDRRLFSKVNTGRGYMPSKKTVITLAIALELSLSETRVLLERAGFSLSRSVLFDVIIECFITNGWYDMGEINSVLYEYDQSLLGG